MSLILHLKLYCLHLVVHIYRFSSRKIFPPFVICFLFYLGFSFRIDLFQPTLCHHRRRGFTVKVSISLSTARTKQTAKQKIASLKCIVFGVCYWTWEVACNFVTPDFSSWMYIGEMKYLSKEKSETESKILVSNCCHLRTVMNVSKVLPLTFYLFFKNRKEHLFLGSSMTFICSFWKHFPQLSKNCLGIVASMSEENTSNNTKY